MDSHHASCQPDAVENLPVAHPKPPPMQGHCGVEEGSWRGKQRPGAPGILGRMKEQLFTAKETQTISTPKETGGWWVFSQASRNCHDRLYLKNMLWGSVCCWRNSSCIYWGGSRSGSVTGESWMSRTHLHPARGLQPLTCQGRFHLTSAPTVDCSP